MVFGQTMKKKRVLQLLVLALAFFCIMQHAFFASAQEDETGGGDGSGGGGGGGKQQALSIKPDPKIVRTAVIGGMTMTKLWDEIARRFEAKTGYKVVVVATGPRTVLDPVFRAGGADLLTMHSGDITTDLVADGCGINMRPWTRNDLVIVGPPSDPAKIKGLKDGVEAIRRIAQTQSPFIDALEIGGRELGHTLWNKAHIKPMGSWYLKDESAGERNILLFAEQKNAYVIVGRMPVLYSKMPHKTIQIMVEGDLLMRRPYIVMEANPKRFPDANYKGARALSDFLLSEETQKFLAEFGTKEFGGLPLFYPVWPFGKEMPL